MKHQIIDKCSEALFQAIEVDHALNGSASHSATAVVHTKDGCVELYIDCYGAQASVVHKREANNTHPLHARSGHLRSSTRMDRRRRRRTVLH